jgi:hypothetical protein
LSDDTPSGFIRSARNPKTTLDLPRFGVIYSGTQGYVFLHLSHSWRAFRFVKPSVVEQGNILSAFCSKQSSSSRENILGTITTLGVLRQ